MHRLLIVVAVFALAVTGCAHRTRSAPEYSEPMAAHKLQRLSEDYWDHYARNNPITATYLADRRFDDQLPDITPEGRARQLEQARFLHHAVVALNPKELSTADRLTHETLLALLDGFIQSDVCQLPLWDVNALNGIQTELGELPSLHGVRTPEHAETLITRYQKSGAYLDQHIANLRAGLDGGYRAPKVGVRRVIEQLDAMLSTAPEASPFVTEVKLPADFPAEKREGVQARLVSTVRENVLPGLDRYREFLQGEYLAKARDEIGVAANTNGAKCYQARILDHTHLRLTPEEIHRIGTEQAERNLAEMKAIAKKLIGIEDVAALSEHLGSDPAQRVKTRQELMDYASGLIDRANAKLPEVLGRLPQQDVKVKAIEAFREASSPTGYYYSASETEQRPGYFYLNTYAPETRKLFLLQSLTFHETVPGHHVQSALAQEVEGLPRFRRELGDGAFTEGWAHYAELLADELGLYDGEAGRFGMLSDQALRAVRLVVDTGMHHLGWSREQALQYALDHTAEPRAELEREIDRYIVWPAQALSYKLGQLEIIKLRARAQAALGEKFDLKAFHDEVLRNGAIPLPVLREVIEAWIERRQAEGTPASPSASAS